MNTIQKPRTRISLFLLICLLVLALLIGIVSNMIWSSDVVQAAATPMLFGFQGNPTTDIGTTQGTPPTAPVVDVTPNSPKTNDNLICTIVTPSFDADGDTVTYTYEWYKDDVLQPAETTVTTGLTDTLSSALTTKHEIWKCVVTPSDGVYTGPTAQDEVTILNTAPTAPVPRIRPYNPPPKTNDNLVCWLSLSYDADGDSITYTYAWYKNDVLQPALTGTTVNAALTTKGETWKCVVTPYDGEVNGPSGQDQVTIVNTPPTAPVVNVTPDSPLTSDDLLCTVTTPSTDADGDTITYTYQWYKNNVLQPDETTVTTGLTDTLSSALTTSGETWKCVVTPYDGEANGPLAQDQVTILGNTAPTAPVVDVTPNSPNTNDDLVCTITTPSTDADGNTITYTYEWYKNNVLQPGETTVTTGLTDTLSSALTAKGETWKCVVTPNDGMTNGPTAQDQVTIGNTAPTAPVVDVTPNNPLTTDDLLCTITTPSTDDDGDPINYTYAWYKNDVLQLALTGATVSAADTGDGETWRCVVTPDDGTVNGSTSQDEVTIGNNPPTAPVVDVTPNSPLTNDGLVCTITTPSTDADGDTITYTYEWYKDNLLQPGETTTTTDLTDSLSSALTAKGETWKCVVTPSDGTANGPTAQDEVTIGNTAPTAPVVNVTPDSPLTGDDLVCTITTASTDNDGDTITYTYEWYKDNVLQPALTGTTVSANDTSDGETWRCVVTPNDGTANGPTAQDQVTINAGTTTTSGGGGGGGGASGATSLVQYTTNSGLFITDATIESVDGKVKLFIPKGTIAKNANGQRLYSISIKPSSDPPVPPYDFKGVCLDYEIGPSGATFDPPIYLTFKYSDSDIPAGVTEENLVIATWMNGQWIQFEGGIIDTVNNTITVLISHFTVFTVMVNTSVASFEITGMDIIPNEVYLTEKVIVNVTVTNTGGLTGSYDVTLKINGVALPTTKVTIVGGESQTISFTVTPDKTGAYTAEVNGLSSGFSVREPVPEKKVVEEPIPVPVPASFTVSDLSVTPGEVNPLEEVIISAVVTNIGGSVGSYTVVLKIDDREDDKQEISLNPGKNATLFFSVTRYTAGNHTIDINGHAGQFTVKPIPADETPPIPPSTNWWLLGGIIAGAVIIVGIVIFIYKRLYDPMKYPTAKQM